MGTTHTKQNDIAMRSPVAAAPYLELVFDDDGAQVYELKDSTQ